MALNIIPLYFSSKFFILKSVINMQIPPHIINRLKTEVVIDGECILWKGPKDKNGYGTISWTYGKHYREQTHRVAYYLKHGQLPVRVGHKCGNILCLNVNHLELYQGKGGRPRSVDYNVVLTLSEEGFSHKEIAKELHIDSSTVSKILEQYSREE